VTGSDEGGFRPHPGDPWHPGWIDDESDDEIESAQTESAQTDSDSPEHKKQKKPKRRSRRERRAEKAEAGGPEVAFDSDLVPAEMAEGPSGGVDPIPAEVAEDPSGGVDPIPAEVAEDVADASDLTVDAAEDLSDGADLVPAEVAEGLSDDGDPLTEVDPFDAVLEQEGPTTRFRAGSDDEAPPPAWTIDEPPDPEQVLPVEQPSWIGQTTGATPGVEAVEFEAEQLETPEQAMEESISEEVGSAVDETVDVEPVFAADLSVTEAPDMGDEIVGEYGVAGPEAFDALTTDDTSTGEIDDWDSYGAEPEPRRRRRFGRRKGASEEEEAVDDGFVGAATEPDLVSDTPDTDTDDSAFGRPAEPPAGVEAFDEWYETKPVKKRGLFRRRKKSAADIVDDGFGGGGGHAFDDWPVQPDDQQFEDELPSVPSPESVVVDDVAQMPPDEVPFLAADEFSPEAPDDAGDVAAALAEALEALEVGDDDLGPVDIEPSLETVPEVSVEAGGTGEQGDLFAEPEGSQPADQATLESPAAAEPEGLDQFPDAELEDVAHWQGDPGRLPADWMADIDEDEVVPPQVAQTPDTELVDESDGSWEGQAQWQAEPVDLFDIEEPEVVAEAPQEAVQIPEGYEPWQEAVADAVESGSDLEAGIDDGTYEYEQPLLQGGLPEGFEPFPGGSEAEAFELPEETMLSHLETTEEGWVTDDVDVAAMPTEAMDVPYSGDTEFDDEIYAAGGTIEHRDLAAAIAEAGEEQTQWQAISAAMPGMETGVLGFEDVADLGSGGEYVAPARSNFGARVATGLVLVALLFGSLLLASAAFAVFIGLVVMLGLVEFYGALRRAGYLPLGLFGIIGGIGTLVATWFHGPLAIPVGLLLTSMVTFFFYAFSPTRRDALSNGGLTTLGLGWVVATAAFAIPIGRAEERVVLVFAIVAVTAATDIGAYWSGRTWGKRPMAPVLSPNKTTEGLVGAVVVAFLVAGAIGFFELGPFDLKSGLALGAVAAFLAPIGDLSESMIKRSLGVKDMGSILPGHGGILDRIDAFLFVIPAAWVFYEAIGFLA
jgi:phosphatidate cytidylyltransferase